MKRNYLIVVFYLITVSLYSQNGADCSSAILLENTFNHLPKESGSTETWYKFKAPSDDLEIRIDADYLLFKAPSYGICSKISEGKIKPVRKFVNPADSLFGKTYSITEEELSGKCCCYNCLKQSGKIKLEKHHLYYLHVKGNPDSLHILPDLPAENPSDQNIKAGQEIENETELKETPSLDNFSINDLQVGNKIELKNIYFKPGKVQMLPESQKTLQKLYDLLEQNSSLKIEIQGHVHGPFSINNNYFQELSEGRAKVIYNYLVQKGIGKERLAFKGYGNNMMLFPNAIDETEASRNRRVEILVVSK